MGAGPASPGEVQEIGLLARVWCAQPQLSFSQKKYWTISENFMIIFLENYCHLAGSSVSMSETTLKGGTNGGKDTESTVRLSEI